MPEKGMPMDTPRLDTSAAKSFADRMLRDVKVIANIQEVLDAAMVAEAGMAAAKVRLQEATQAAEAAEREVAQIVKESASRAKRESDSAVAEIKGLTDAKILDIRARAEAEESAIAEKLEFLESEAIKATVRLEDLNDKIGQSSYKVVELDNAIAARSAEFMAANAELAAIRDAIAKARGI
jgi:chromosome segregation ATPase